MTTTTELYTPEHLERWTADGPTAFDSAANYCGADLGAFYVAPVSFNRDGDTVTESNWRVVTRDLEKLIRHNDSGVARMGHWACGWYELFLIHESDTEALKAADEWAAALESYPVADESDLSELEYEEECEAWEQWAAAEWAGKVADALETYNPDPEQWDWAELIVDQLSTDALGELWCNVSIRLSWSVQHDGSGPSFNLDDAAEALTRQDLADLTGLPLLAPDQQWRREPYPWPGAESAPLVEG